MASHRMTNDLRNQIIDAGCNFVVGDQEKELKILGTEILKVLRVRRYPADIMQIIEKLPRAFVGDVNHAYIHIDRNDGGSRCSFQIHAAERVVFAHADSFYLQVALHAATPEDHSAIRLCDLYYLADQKLKAVTERFKAMAKPIVKQVTTVKKLLEVWPDCAEFLPKHLMEPPVKEMLPAPVTDTVDQMIAAAVARRAKTAITEETTAAK